MNRQYLLITMTAGLLIATGSAVADHNSKNGEGTANMPNDIHNTRIETRESDDNEAFRDFVKYGNGAESVNRFDTDAGQANDATRQRAAKTGRDSSGKDPAVNGNRNQSQAAATQRNRAETRSRNETQSMNAMQERGRSAAGNRGGGRRH